MPLTDIGLAPKNFPRGNLNFLRECKTLKTVVVEGSGRMATQQFWQKYDANEFAP
jgi:hypothetical protein